MEQVIFKSEKKAFTIIFISVIIATAGLLFLHYTDSQVVGWSFMILSVLCLILGLGTLFDRKPHLILTANGITDLTGTGEEVEWDVIRRVDYYFYRGQYIIRLLLARDYKPLIIKPLQSDRFDRFYQKEGLKALYIRNNLNNINSSKLTRFINRMLHADKNKKADLIKLSPENW